VGTVAVVVTGVGSKDPFEMPFVHDQEVLEALRSHGAHEPLGMSIGIRGPKGRVQDLSALGSKASSKPATNLASRSRTKNRAVMSAQARSPVTFLAC
jgi:hypothetical protein